MQLFIIILIIIVSALDALRDAWYGQKDFRTWHLVKWAAFYPPLIVLLVTFVDWHWWVPVVVAAWIAWRIGAVVVGKKGWKSFWISKLRG